MRWVALWTAFVVVCLEAGCSHKPKPPPLSEAAERGRLVYLGNCIACHNADPAKSGAVGPSVKGSSRDLIEARVTRAGYPPGYTPKRETKLMIPLPQLTEKVDDLAAYLQ